MRDTSLARFVMHVPFAVEVAIADPPRPEWPMIVSPRSARGIVIAASEKSPTPRAMVSPAAAEAIALATVRNGKSQLRPSLLFDPFVSTNQTLPGGTTSWPPPSSSLPVTFRFTTRPGALQDAILFISSL